MIVPLPPSPPSLPPSPSLLLQSLRQIWTLYPHTPDNSFLGFVMEQPSNSPSHTKRKNQAVIYDKEGTCR